MADTTSRIDTMARLLIDARASGNALDSLPPELEPQNHAEAQMVDDRVAELSGWPVRGWKIGCTSEHAQKMLGTDGPFAGRVYSVYESGAEVDTSMLMVDPLLEGEIAFVFARSLDPPASASPDAVRAAIGAVAPAIEFVGGRFNGFPNTPLLNVIADAGANSLLVVGKHNSGVDIDALGDAQAEMKVGGETTGAGTGADVLGHPFNALMWLVDHLADRGLGIEADQVVTTGTATQVSPLPVGSTAIATVDGLGSVAVTHSTN